MIVPYTRVHPESPRLPLLDVTLGAGGFAVRGLVDSGAVNTLFETWVADEAGIDLDGTDERALRVGPEGAGLTARFTTVQLSVGDFSWEAEVGFCETIAGDFGLLGQEGFFRWFEVDFRRADLTFEVRPIGA